MSYNIKAIKSRASIEASVKVLRAAYSTVIERFGILEEKVPSNTAFITYDDLIKLKNNGDKFFGLFLKSKQIGFIALEKANNSVYYIKKVAIIPEHRNKGFGKKLLDFCFEYAKSSDVEKISISIMNEDTPLKNWYINYGFREITIKEFPHLPFNVCYLEKPIE